MESTAGTAKEVVDELRSGGESVELLKIETFRLWLFDAVNKALKGVDYLAVMEHIEGLTGFESPLFVEIHSSLYELHKRSDIYGYIYGLGRRDISPLEIADAYEDLMVIEPVLGVVQQLQSVRFFTQLEKTLLSDLL